METPCKKTRRLATQDGRATACEIEAVAQHADECAQCQDYLDALIQLESALIRVNNLDSKTPKKELPKLEPHTNTDSRSKIWSPTTLLVAGWIRRSFRRERLVRIPEFLGVPRWFRRSFSRWWLVGIPILIFVLLFLFLGILTHRNNHRAGLAQPKKVYAVRLSTVQPLRDKNESQEEEKEEKPKGYNLPRAQMRKMPIPSETPDEPIIVQSDSPVIDFSNSMDLMPAVVEPPSPPPPDPPPPGLILAMPDRISEPKKSSERKGNSPSPALFGNDLSATADENGSESPGGLAQLKRQDTEHGARFGDDRKSGKLKKDRFEKEVLRYIVGGEVTASQVATNGSSARTFLAERETLDDLVFQEPRGYWENTYVPGDRDLREMQLRLAAWDRREIASPDGQTPQLHDAVTIAKQPFDESHDAAVALFLHADRRGLKGRERFLMEVGLQATSRRSGRLPTMNLGLVLDLRQPLTTEQAKTMRALIEAFVRTHDLGDRFSITVAGDDHRGVQIPPEDFRYGPVSLFLNDLLSITTAQANPTSLHQAVKTAYQSVQEETDPSAPLGSSAILIVTAHSPGDETESLATLAHHCAVEGVPVNIVGVGKKIEIQELDRIVIAGQGHRRLMNEPGEANRMAEQVLAAVGRTVARAIRLNIRLAPGIQLVDVLGSRRLDEPESDRIRAAEQSIDFRLSHNLGIQSDRGLDDDGIQIVIPAIYAGDSHVVLLDLVAPGPGPIADVTVRYKDLVFLRNGTASAQLSLGRDESQPGPLETNVTKNLLARHIGSAFEHAARELTNNAPAKARQLLTDLQILLAELPLELPGLAGDPDLANDAAVLAGYLHTLARPEVEGSEHLERLSDSMRYVGKLRALQSQMIAD